jgi:hypothetical protein
VTLATKTCTRCEQEQSEANFCRDITRATGLHPWCKSCRKESERERNRKAPEKLRAKTAKWRANNPDRVRELNKAAHHNRKEQRNEESRVYRAANLEKMRAQGRAWSKNNPEAWRATNNARRAAKVQAVPNWANDEFDELVVGECYDLSIKRTTATGMKWHVDHIVPLRSKSVCGLHCAANLQVIPALINFSKGNRVWPNMPK